MCYYILYMYTTFITVSFACIMTKNVDFQNSFPACATVRYKVMENQHFISFNYSK